MKLSVGEKKEKEERKERQSLRCNGEERRACAQESASTRPSSSPTRLCCEGECMSRPPTRPPARPPARQRLFHSKPLLFRSFEMEPIVRVRLGAVPLSFMFMLRSTREWAQWSGIVGSCACKSLTRKLLCEIILVFLPDSKLRVENDCKYEPTSACQNCCYTGIGARMSYRKWRENKQHLI